MKILAMDTAAPQGGVALLEDDRLLAAQELDSPSGHVVALAVAVEALLASQGCQMADIGLLVVTLGPGSFTGVRVALGFAKGIELAQGIPMVGLTSLELIAAGAEWHAGPVAALLDARRGELFAAIYQVEANGALTTLLAPAVWSPEGFADHLAGSQEAVFCTGGGLAPYGALFRERLAERFQAAPQERWRANPTLLGRLGQQRWLAQGTAGAELEPLYLRRAEAERNRMALEKGG